MIRRTIRVFLEPAPPLRRRKPFNLPQALRSFYGQCDRHGIPYPEPPRITVRMPFTCLELFNEQQSVHAYGFAKKLATDPVSDEGIQWAFRRAASDYVRLARKSQAALNP